MTLQARVALAAAVVCPAAVLLAIPEHAGQPSWATGEELSSPGLFAPGDVSTGDYESHPAFTSDGRELFYVKSNAVFTSWTIVVSRFGVGRWSTPRVAPFSGQYNDADPLVTPDGRRLYFISDRPRAAGDTRTDMDIWYVDRTPEGWHAPVNLGPPVNSPASEWFPTLAADGTLYFGSGREGGKGATDLYRAAPTEGGAFREPENLGSAINTAADEYEPLISPDQTLLIFMAAGRKDSLGDGDLYISRAVAGTWTPAKNLGRPINSPAREISPYITPDRKYFFFSSARQIRSRPQAARTYEEVIAGLRGPGNGLGDLYRLNLDAVLSGVRHDERDSGASQPGARWH